MFKKMLIEYIICRSLETSTVRGLVLFLAGSIGLTLSDYQSNEMIYIIFSVVGLIGTFFPDNFIGEAFIKDTNKNVSKTIQTSHNTNTTINKENFLKEYEDKYS